MILMENLALGIGFVLNWLLLLSSGVILLLLITYLVRRILSPRQVEIEQTAEPKSEEGGENGLELIAGISAVLASLQHPIKTEHVREITKPTVSLWKISSMLYSSRYREVELG